MRFAGKVAIVTGAAGGLGAAYAAALAREGAAVALVDMAAERIEADSAATRQMAAGPWRSGAI